MIVHDDCLRYMQLMEPNSVDAIVTDPPYGLSFMGKGWDKGVPGIPFWEAMRDALKPGAYLLAFGGTRTFHRMAVAIEDAGFEIRDTLSWLYGSGFPKSHDVGKAIDKLAGAEREVIGESPYNARRPNPPVSEICVQAGHKAYITAPATDAAKQWNGWGTALKPAWEPIIVARKPLEGTVAANVLTHGTGAINVDACRIAHNEPIKTMVAQKTVNSIIQQSGRYAETTELKASGRWPANVVLDDEAAALLDAQSGITKSSAHVRRNQNVGWKCSSPPTDIDVPYSDTGGASRFFYCAKSSRSERNAGLEGMPERAGTQRFNASDLRYEAGREPTSRAPQSAKQNHHPTVKPISLMRWLVRLVTPPGGTVLDPFAGSGTTGCAAALEGFQFIGIERESEYVAIAERRIAHWAAQSQQLTFAEVAS